MNLPKIVGTLACKYANKVEESYQDSNAEVVMLLTDFARELLSAPPEEKTIGEVIGHKEMGLALVQWSDNGLRPIGTKLYAFSPQKTTTKE